jgi:hypothetical protein
MTTYGMNGVREATEFEVTHYSNPYAGEGEDELEVHEWEMPELAHEASHESEDEMEWELPEMAPAHVFAATEYEDEWESPETHEMFPPRFARRPLMRRVRRLLPLARAAMPGVVRIIIGIPAGSLLRQLGPVVREGEYEATAFEAQLFGTNEAEGEVAGHESAHEAALTEVLAAEAAHTEQVGEAEALLGAALPITIRIMGGGRGVRRITPTLMRANTRLVSSLHRGGAARRQLVRLVPTIHRRTIASLRAAQRAGRPLTPQLAARVMAAQSARVLGSPAISGRALVRNAAIRQSTVAPAGGRIRRKACKC